MVLKRMLCNENEDNAILLLLQLLSHSCRTKPTRSDKAASNVER